MKKILFGGTAAVALVSGTALLAQVAPPAKAPHAGRKMMMQTELRTDVSGHVQRMFARLDTNKDGFITQAELSALQEQRQTKLEERAEHFAPAKLFSRLDANNDGKITQAEIDAAHAARAQAKGAAAPAQAHSGSRLMARLDANKDGVVTRTEFDAAAAQMHAHMEQAAMQHGGFGAHLLQAADLNKDGRVSLAEMQQMALQHFDQADLNHDGKLMPDERKQFRQAQHAQHKA